MLLTLKNKNLGKQNNESEWVNQLDTDGNNMQKDNSSSSSAHYSKTDAWYGNIPLNLAMNLWVEFNVLDQKDHQIPAQDLDRPYWHKKDINKQD